MRLHELQWNTYTRTHTYCLVSPYLPCTAEETSIFFFDFCHDSDSVSRGNAG